MMPSGAPRVLTMVRTCGESDDIELTPIGVVIGRLASRTVVVVVVVVTVVTVVAVGVVVVAVVVVVVMVVVITGGQASQQPPQSTPVSPPFCLLSVHVDYEDPYTNKHVMSDK